MKNALKIIGTILFAAAVAFTFVSCSNGGGGGSSSGKFKFRSAAPPTSLDGRAASRTAGPIAGTTIDEESFAVINDYYKSLGGDSNIVAAYTPTAFNFYRHMIIAEGGGKTFPLLYDESNNIELIDFVQGTTIEMNHKLPANVTVTNMLVLYFETMVYDRVTSRLYPPPTTTFTINTPLAENHPWRKIEYSGYDGKIYHTTHNEGTTITVPTIDLYPGYLKTISSGFMFGGTEYKYINDFTPFKPEWILEYGGFVVPWSGVSNSNMSSITFNVNWDMDNIIVQYNGPDGVANTADDVFVFADKFWYRFSFTSE
jgi:hypothetical protein